MSVNIKLLGEKELGFKLKLLKKLTNTQIKAGLRAGGSIISNAAKDNITKQGLIKSGTMKRSVHVVTPGRKGGGIFVQVGTNITNPPYPAYHEFGSGPYIIRNAFGRGITVNHPGYPARPWLRPALDDNKSKVRIITAFVEHMIEHEKCFIIDSDFFNNDRISIEQVWDKLEYLHEQSSRLIRWCITDKLHAAMEPSRV